MLHLFVYPPLSAGFQLFVAARSARTLFLKLEMLHGGAQAADAGFKVAEEVKYTAVNVFVWLSESCRCCQFSWIMRSIMLRD